MDDVHGRRTTIGCVGRNPARGAPCRTSSVDQHLRRRRCARALRRARDGVALDATEAGVLLQATGDDLVDLCASAARVRDAGLATAGRPGVVTYSRKVFIPLTRLCRDRCHYCTFVTVPGRLPAAYLSPDEVLEIARQGAALGCKEALFTLGDRPEDRWPQAREWLDSHGYDSTLAYLRAMAIRVLEETGSAAAPEPRRDELAGDAAAQAGRAVDGDDAGDHLDRDLHRAVRRAFRLAGQGPGGPAAGAGGRRPQHDPVHHRHSRRHRRDDRRPRGVAVRDPADRPAVRRDPGSDRAELPGQAGHRDAAAPDAGREEYLATIAVARIVLGPKMCIQAPPNLSDPDELAGLLAAGVDDWGGVSPLTPDHVNPERPWPHLDSLAELTAAAGFTLRERLTAHPSYVLTGEPWLDPAGAAARHRVGRPGDRVGRRRCCPAGLAVAGAGPGLGQRRPARPAHRDRHPGPADRHPQRFRRRLRRLGGAARAGAGPAVPDPAGRARRRGERGAAGRGTRPGRACPTARRWP